MGDVRLFSDSDYEGMADDEWIASGDVAAIAGVKPDTVRIWAWKYPDFPVGVRRGKPIKLRRYGDVIAWLCRHGRIECEEHEGLISRVEVAERLGVSTHTVKWYQSQHGFPAPAAKYVHSLYWRADEVDAWAAGRAEAAS